MGIKTKNLSIIYVSIILLCSTHGVQAKDSQKEFNVYDCVTQAEFADGKKDDDSKNTLTSGYWKVEVNVYDEAARHCLVAELKKRAGIYSAEESYRKAIDANKAEPGYNLFLGDYFRNYRGPKQPLFDLAKSEYFIACGKLEVSNCRNIDIEDVSIKSRQKKSLSHGLVSLYEKDGFPLNWANDPHKFEMFFHVDVNHMLVTSDSDERDDIREYTSEAMLVESRTDNPHRTLSMQERLDILRDKDVSESLGKLRLRKTYWPVIDFYIKQKSVDDAQIVNFSVRSDVTDLHDFEYARMDMSEQGIKLEKIISTELFGDYSISAVYSKIGRKGLIEGDRYAEESIINTEYSFTGSRFFGRKKLDVELSLVQQDIEQEIEDPQDRSRTISAIKVDYHLDALVRADNESARRKVSVDRRFASRGVTFFGGMVADEEYFGPDKVVNSNYFVGSSWRGMRLFPSMNVFDASIQATMFSSDVQTVELGMDRDNSQLRLGASVIYRSIDEETNPWPPQRKVVGIPFTSLHYVFNLSSDSAKDGRDYYENSGLGMKVVGKAYSRSLRSTVLGSVSLDYKIFPNLDEEKILGGVQIGVGF